MTNSLIECIIQYEQAIVNYYRIRMQMREEGVRNDAEAPSGVSLPYYNYIAFIGDSDPAEIDGNQKCADCNGWTEDSAAGA